MGYILFTDYAKSRVENIFESNLTHPLQSREKNKGQHFTACPFVNIFL